MKTFLLDTNVLLHDPACLKVFDDNEVVIPLSVLDELDNAKSRLDEVGRNARRAIKELDILRRSGSLSKGVKLNESIVRVELNHRGNIPPSLSADNVDNRILGTAIGLTADGSNVIVVSKDINLRVKCDALGIAAQDYVKDKIAENVEKVYGGVETVNVPSATIDKLFEQKEIEAEFGAYENQFFILKAQDAENHSAIARYKKGMLVPMRRTKEVMSIMPRNAEQRMALDLLLDPDVSLVTLIGKAGSGKAQPLDSKILTPNGFVSMGDLKIGDYVSTPDGGKAKISNIYPQGRIDIFKVFFSDGTSAECSKDHLWYTKSQLDRDKHRSGSVKTLDEIMRSLRYGKCEKRNHSVPITKPIEFNDTELPLDPYLLGLLLGDGCFSDSVSISSSDEEIIKYCASIYDDISITKKAGSKYDYYLKKEPYDGKKNKIVVALDKLGLGKKKSYEKFVPECYKYSSINNRIEILRGLMDSDGYITNSGTSCNITFTSTSKKLAKDVRFLVESLGGTASINSRITKYKHNDKILLEKKSYRLNINCPPDLIPFKLKRKVDLCVPRNKCLPRRYIDKIEYIGKKEAQCIYIEHPDHLYITNNFIVTHNTLMATAAALYHVLTDAKNYARVLISRPVQPMGRDLGYLPGDIDEKLRPWMQPIYDNLEFILGADYQSVSMYEGLVQVEPLTYIRGRSIPKSFIVLDEAQNLTAQEIKTVITRVGEGTKIVITGDIEQIDNPYVDFADNGLTHIVEKLKKYGLAGHITLRKGERSKLATLAAEIL